MDISERMLGYNHQKLENKECLYPQKASSTVEETSDGMKCDNAGRESVMEAPRKGPRLVFVDGGERRQGSLPTGCVTCAES